MVVRTEHAFKAEMDDEARSCTFEHLGCKLA
jgi:hypothetical protein